MLTRRAVNRATLARQLLLDRAELSVTDAVSRLGGLQAQLTAGDALAKAARAWLPTVQVPPRGVWGRGGRALQTRSKPGSAGHSRRRASTLTVQGFRRLNAAERGALETEGAALLAFLHPGDEHDVRVEPVRTSA